MRGKLANLESPKICFGQDYPLGKNNTLMEKNFDPGRIRHYGLLNEVYGSTRRKLKRTSN